MRTFVACVLCALAPLAAGALAAGKNLEELIEGRFTAMGTNRVKPGQPAERIFCRFTGRRVDARVLSLAGRCATADQSARVTMDFTVDVPGRRYGMRIEMDMGALHGYARSYRYEGVATGHAWTFTAPFDLDGKAYVSTFRVALQADDIGSITETVAARDSGEETILIELRIRRE